MEGDDQPDPPQAGRTGPTENPRSRNGGSTHPAGGLEELREILFGARYRSLERRLRAVDDELRSKQLEVEQMKRRIEALAAQLEQDTGSARDAVRDLAKEHREAILGLEQRLARAEELERRAQRDLDGRILEQSRLFIDEVHRVRRDLVALVEGEILPEEASQERAPNATEDASSH